MQTRSLTERCAGALALVSIALVVTGTKACQENYDVGSQANISATASATPTVDGGDDDDLVTAIPTVSGTITAIAGVTGTPESEPVETPEADAATLGDVEGLPASGSQDLDNVSLLEAISEAGEKAPDKVAGAAAGGGAKGEGNWLGRAFKGSADKEGAKKGDSRRVWHDADGDGFADWLESAEGGDAFDAMMVPGVAAASNLDARARATDTDLDGVSNVDERQLGTDPENMDSDSDGRPDGAEVLSHGDPTRPDDRYRDGDGDGLSDDYESAKGLNPQLLDTDEDGLRDDLEITIGSDPLQADSDKDGISDGKEFDLSSDPTVADTSAGK